MDTTTTTHPATIELGPVRLDDHWGNGRPDQVVELVTPLLVDIDHPYDPAGTLYRVTTVRVVHTGAAWVSLVRQRKSGGGDFARGGFASVDLDKLLVLDRVAATRLRYALVTAGLVPVRIDPTVNGYLPAASIDADQLRRGDLVLWNSRLRKVVKADRPRGGARRLVLAVLPAERFDGEAESFETYCQVDHALVTYKRVTR